MAMEGEMYRATPKRILKCGFNEVDTSFLRTNTLKKGRNLWECSHVFNVEESFFAFNEFSERKTASKKGLGSTSVVSHITGKVIPQTNVNNSPYNVLLKINQERKIKECSCTCKAGQDTCKHMAAICFHVNNEEPPSKTSRTQEWGKPSIQQIGKYKKGKRISAMFPQVVPCAFESQPIAPKPVLPYIRDINCPFTYLLLAEETMPNSGNEAVKNAQVSGYRDNIQDVFDNILSSSLPIYSVKERVTSFIERLNPQERCIYQKIMLTSDQKLDICMETVSQSACRAWRIQRSYRITSTTAGKICRRKGNFQKLALQLLCSTFKGNQATEYGVRTEKEARVNFESLQKVKVDSLGLVISSEHPWLACSPDGVFVKNH